MSHTARSVFFSLVIAASLTACSVPTFSATATNPPRPPESPAPPVATDREKLQAIVTAGLTFTAVGVDLGAVLAALERGQSMLTKTYELPPVWPLVDYNFAASAIVSTRAAATAQAVVVEAARVAAEAESARLAVIQAAAVEAAAAREAATKRLTAPRVIAPAAQRTPSIYQLKVVGIAHNQADLDRCGVMDVSAWMGARQIATHWQCGRGYLIPRDPGQLFTVTGAGALDGNYVSIGIVGTLNQKTQTTADIPHHYDLIITTCLNNDSTRMMMLVLNRIP